MSRQLTGLLARTVAANRRTVVTDRVDGDLHFDYTTVGHVTVDVMADGSRRPGGTAFYSALQAARLGRRARIITRGAAHEIEELIAPYRGELELEILPAEQTTTFETSGHGCARRQRMLAWAGPLEEDLMIDSAIMHLAPVARETPSRWRGRAGFVGLTAQGLVRRWAAEDGEISLAAPSRAAAERVAHGCDAIVLSRHERASCAGLLSAARTAGAVIAVTAGAAPNTILLPDGRILEVQVPAVEHPCDDLGAGDVFAAAFFVSLADGAPAARAAVFANAAAAVRMRGPGVEAIGARAAIEARLQAGASSSG